MPGIEQQHDPAYGTQELRMDRLAILGVQRGCRVLAKIVAFCVANRALHGTPPQRMDTCQAALAGVAPLPNLLKVSVNRPSKLAGGQSAHFGAGITAGAPHHDQSRVMERKMLR
jgi:hypothetical protein